MDVQVVVAGAGPTGLMLAAELRLAGVEVAVLERLPAPSGESRSLGLNPRAVELWDQRGLLERFGNPRFLPRGHYGALPVPLGFDRLDSPYGVMMMPQRRTEQVLGAWAGELGADLRRGHELRGLRQDGQGVELDVSGPGGGYTLRAGWLVGADGAHSTVRRLAGIDFPGTASTVDVVMADVSGVDLELRLFHRGERGLWAVFPIEDGIFRVVVYVFGRGAADRDAGRPSFDEVRELALAVGGPDLAGGTAHWLSRHGNTTRIADRYRQGRVLLVGDAAHVQPPAGGMALTTGLGDAVNLGWKLAAEVHGRAPAGLLDSYQDERRPVGERVMTHTRVQNLLMSGGLESAALRTVMAELLAVPGANDLISGEVSTVAVRYDLGEGHDLLGRRVPPLPLTLADGTAGSTLGLLHGARGVLLDLTGDPALEALAADWATRVDLVTATVTAAPAAAPATTGPAAGGPGLAGVAALLVRPDGHVAWVGTVDGEADKAGLLAALARWFGEAAP